MRAHFRMRTTCAIRYGSGMTRTLPSRPRRTHPKTGNDHVCSRSGPQRNVIRPLFFAFLGVLLGGLLLRVYSFHRQAHAALVVGFQHLDLHDLAFLQVIGNGVHALVADLRDVQQAVASGQELHDGAEVEQAQHRPLVDLAHFDVGRDVLDALLRRISALGRDAGNGDGAVVLDLDGGAGLLLDAPDHDAALADDVADLVRVDLHLDDARREGGELGARALDRLLHDLQDLQARLPRLVERHLHDALVDRLDLEVHLQGGDALVGPRDLEVHVAEVVLVAEDVGEHGEAVAFLDEAHGDAGDVRLDGRPGIHEGEAAATHRSHRRGAVRLGNLGHHADRITELFLRRQQAHQRALGEAAMADLAALGGAHASGLAGRVGRHVVVHHEALAVLPCQRVDDLLVAPGPEGDGDEGLGLSPREQSRAMRARQHADADRNRPHGARVAAIDARLAVEDLPAHDLRLEVEEDVLQIVRVDLDTDLLGLLCELLGDFLADFLQPRIARLLLLHTEGLAQVGFGELGHARDERIVPGRRLPFPGRLAGHLGELVDRLDRRLHVLMAVHHPAQHHVLGKLERLGLHHHHALLRARDDQVELGLLELAHRRVDHVLAADIADARGADRSVERDAR